MNSSRVQIRPNPPSLMKSLLAGFDAVSNHVGLILFSITLDLFLWFGPRLRLTTLFESALNIQAEMTETANTDVFGWLMSAIEDFNLASALRTFPVGIPSLMVSRSPTETPIGNPMAWEIESPLTAIGLWAIFSVIGILAGSLYFLMVSEAALSEKMNWNQVIRCWPWASGQVFLLSILGMVLIFAISLPLTYALTFILISGSGMEMFIFCGFMIFAGILMWLLVPLIFSPFGIFVGENPMWTSVRKGIRLTRFTLPTTLLLFFSVIVLSEGLRALWNVPANSSWWTLIGMVGHAFVTTSLLAGCFVYYRDADRWLQNILQQTETNLA